MDEVLQEVGHCGKFQLCHVTLTQFCRLVSAWILSIMVFGLYNPGWKCRSPALLQASGVNTTGSNNATSSQDERQGQWSSGNPAVQGNSSLLNNPLYPGDLNAELNVRYSQWTETAAKIYNKTNFTNSSSSALKKLKVTCDVIDACEYVDFDDDSRTIVTEFGLVCDRVWIAYLIVSILNGGMVAGAFVWGQVGERFGRKISLYGSCLVMTLSCGLAVFSHSWQVYGVFNFFIGFGAVNVLPAVIILSMEFLNAVWRARVVSIPIWNLGTASFAFLIYLLPDWRHIHLVCAAFSGLVCLGCFWVPESLRWLVLHRRRFRAEKVLAKIARLNRTNVPRDTVQRLTEERHRTVAAGETDRHYTYADLFRTARIRCLVLKLAFLRIAITVTYDIVGYSIQALPGDFYTNFAISSLVNIPTTVAAGWLAQKIGRRRAGVVFFGIGTFGFLATAVALAALDSDSGVRDVVITASALLSRTAIIAVTGVSVLLMVELLPTSVRNLAFGIFNTSCRLAGVAMPYLIARDSLSMLVSFVTLMVTLFVASVITFSLPETKDQGLEDS